MFVRPVLCYAICALFAPRGTAQIPPFSDGPMVGMSTAFSVDEGTGLIAAGHAAEPFLKPRGFTSGPPPVLTAPTIDFSISKLFRSCVGGTPLGAGAAAPEIDAISLGLDILPIVDGALTVPLGHWDGMLFSVREGTMGQPGSRLRDELSRPGGNHSDLLSYIFESTICLPPEVQGVTHKMADSLDFGLPLDAEVDAVDIYASLYELGDAVGLPALPTLYFSVEGSALNLGRVPASWWVQGVTPVTPSGAVVFKSDWTGTDWTCPTVFLTPADLGLTSGEDVDAIALEGTAKIVFSTSTVPAVPGPPRNQLLFLSLSEDATPDVLTTAGEEVVEAIGLLEGSPTDDVDGVCIYDPVCGNRQPGTGIPIENAMGFVWNATPPIPLVRALELQAYRTPPDTRYQYGLYMLGGQPGDRGIWGFTVPPQPLPSPPAWPAFPICAPFTVANTGFRGNPVQLNLPLPRIPGIDVVVQAFMVPAGGPFTIVKSFPVRIPLR